jgi:hypothetical protein
MCLLNKDIQTKFRTDCADYLEKETLEPEERFPLVRECNIKEACHRWETRQETKLALFNENIKSLLTSLEP